MEDERELIRWYLHRAARKQRTVLVLIMLLSLVISIGQVVLSTSKIVEILISELVVLVFFSINIYLMNFLEIRYSKQVQVTHGVMAGYPTNVSKKHFILAKEDEDFNNDLQYVCFVEKCVLKQLQLNEPVIIAKRNNFLNRTDYPSVFPNYYPSSK